jgi:hypothetical protein
VQMGAEGAADQVGRQRQGEPLHPDQMLELLAVSPSPGRGIEPQQGVPPHRAARRRAAVVVTFTSDATAPARALEPDAVRR